MAEQENWATYAARLASFEVSVPVPTKKRSSNAKGTKALSWPHHRPTPADLAKAGFYYKPSIENPDNTLCFMCDRQLDGWEEEDDPVVEHLKHSEQCGWAIIVNLEHGSRDPATIEDPTESRIADARRDTFASGWPHEAKRGWTCKTEKMVQAGWHFAPTPESDDFVSCAYCKLSLDGWEPKDNPFDEHYRRSSDCPFFSFAGTTAPKAGKGRKPRASKACRLSTQSNLTVASEVPSIPDLDESIDTSTLSVLSTASSMGKKKSGRGKSKSTRSKKTEQNFVSHPELSTIEVEAKSDASKTARGKKRTSDQISEDNRRERESTVKPEPPAKRRNTRSRESVMEQVDYPSLDRLVNTEEQAAPEKPVRGGRKRVSSRSRQTSGASLASLRGTIPDIAAIDAALEAELDNPLSDEEEGPAPEQKPKRGQSKKVTASIAPTRSTRQAIEELEVHTTSEQTPDDAEASAVDEDVTSQATTKKGRKPRATKKATGKQRPSNDTIITVETNIEPKVESSMLTAQTAVDDDSGHETDASVANKSKSKKGGNKKAASKVKGKKADTGLMSKNIEDIVQAQAQAQPEAENALACAIIPQQDLAAAIERDEMDADQLIAALTQEIEEEDAAKKASKPAKANKAKKPAKSKIPAKAPHLDMPGAFSPMIREETVDPSFASVLSSNSSPLRVTTNAQMTTEQDEEVEIHPTTKDSSPTPTRQREQKALSPGSSPSAQSSDAENAPPSSRPEYTRPPLGLMSPNKVVRVQLAPGTPTTRIVPLSPSKIGGGLTSQIPWTSVDVEMVFANTPDKKPLDMWAGGPSDTAEHGMTVEQWIYANAVKAEEDLRMEGERIVNVFEAEGQRAMEVLEGIECL